MMFGSNLKRRVGSRCLVGAFEGCWAGICRLGKEIGFRKIWHFFSKSKKFRHPIFLPSLRIPAEQPPNTSTRPLITSRLFSFLPNTKGSQEISSFLNNSTKNPPFLRSDVQISTNNDVSSSLFVRAERFPLYSPNEMTMPKSTCCVQICPVLRRVASSGGGG
jgi:hypothetical protein